MKEWWLDKHEVIVRLDAIGEQLRSFPGPIIIADGWQSTRINIIGKAIGCLTTCLMYFEDKELFDKPTKEDVCWYSMVMEYWKKEKV